MIINITIEQWSAPFGADNEPGLLIPFEDFNIEFPIIQVYKHLSGNDYQLVVNPLDLAVLNTNNNIHLIGSTPFNGKVVIK